MVAGPRNHLDLLNQPGRPRSTSRRKETPNPEDDRARPSRPRSQRIYASAGAYLHGQDPLRKSGAVDSGCGWRTAQAVCFEMSYSRRDPSHPGGPRSRRTKKSRPQGHLDQTERMSLRNFELSLPGTWENIDSAGKKDGQR
jgi:hypothetical protein